jgi:DNA-binding FrmR family transcriptional regulator
MESNNETRQRLLDRLSRIEGQVRGIKKMIEEERGCYDVIKQVGAAAGALRSVQKVMLEYHMAGCLENAVASGADRKRLVHDLVENLGDILK